MNRNIHKLLLVISSVVCVWFFSIYGKESYPFYGDSMGYYMYLPSTFIYHNHKELTWLPKDKHFDNTVLGYLNSLKSEDIKTPKGYLINKYTYGVAAMEMPFFFVAHGYEKLTGRAATGYSASYRIMLKISTLFYALFGMILLFRVLRFFFNQQLSLIGMSIIFMGTNLFWFTLHQQGMAHVPLFFLYALLIYITLHIHKQPRNFLFIVAGFVAGMITIIRPVDIVCMLIPILYNVYDRHTAKLKISFLTAHIKGLALFAIAFIFPIIPQLLYWKMMSGSFFYYSYGNEHFNWLHPKIFEGLFSFSNGWLIYSPVMIFAIAGIVFYKNFIPVIAAIILLLPVYVYIVYSWHCYYYINGLGSRPMIHLYPLLAIPLTAFIQKIAQQKLYFKALFFSLFLFFISINIAYCLQKVKGILNSEESNMTYNLNMLFKMKATYSDLVMCDVEQKQPAANTIEKIASLACENYEDSLSDHYIADTSGKSRFVYHMLDEEEYHPKKIWVTYKQEVFKNAKWIKCSGRFLCPKPYSYFKHLLTLSIMKHDSLISWSGCRIDNKIGLTDQTLKPAEYTFSHSSPNQWGSIYYFIKLPKGLADGDKFLLDIWNIGKQEIYFDDICLELYRNKN